MTRVQDELAKEITEDSPIESHLNQLPYLQACMKETLRLHPPAPLLIPHQALESCKVMDYTIPKNAQVTVNAWAIGRDPFGAGRRICPGLPMAAKHVPLIVASLIHFFEWSLPHGKDPTELDMAEKYNMTMQKKQPLVLVPGGVIVTLHSVPPPAGSLLHQSERRNRSHLDPLNSRVPKPPCPHHHPPPAPP